MTVKYVFPGSQPPFEQWCFHFGYLKNDKPPKINMAPENRPLEKEIHIGKPLIC